jgi:hypothetical protein
MGKKNLHHHPLKCSEKDRKRDENDVGNEVKIINIV